MTMKKVIIGGEVVCVKPDYNDNEVLFIEKIDRQEFLAYAKLFTYKFKTVNLTYRFQTVNSKHTIKKNVLYYTDRIYFSPSFNEWKTATPNWDNICFIERYDGYYKIFPYIQYLDDLFVGTYLKIKISKIFKEFYKHIHENQTTDLFSLREIALYLTKFEEL